MGVGRWHRHGLQQVRLDVARSNSRFSLLVVLALPPSAHSNENVYSIRTQDVTRNYNLLLTSFSAHQGYLHALISSPSSTAKRNGSHSSVGKSLGTVAGNTAALFSLNA